MEILKEGTGTDLKLVVKLSKSEFNEVYKDILKDLSKKARIKGFKPGTAPLKLVENYFGRQRVLTEALQEAMNRYYSKAIEREEIYPVKVHEVKVEKFNPDDEEALTFSVQLEVMPKVELPPLSDIVVKLPEKKVTEEDINEQLESMRETLATYEKVDEPVDDGYRVRLAYEMKEGDKVVAGNIDEEHVVEVDENSLLPAIYENIIGMRAEEQKTFKVSFPEDFHIKDLAGKEVEVRLAVKEVMKKVLPEVDDEFAKKLKAKDLNELKDQIKKALESAYESLNKRSALNQVFNYLMEHVEVPLPKSMVEHQMEHLREDILKNWRSLEDYLKERGITEEEFNQEIRKRAERDVKAMIIMDALTKELGVSVSPDDVRKLIETDDTFRMRFFQLLQSGFSPEAAFNDIYQSVLNELLARKVWDVVTKEFYKEGEEAVAEAINEALATGESSND